MDGDAPRMTPAVRAMWLPLSAATIKDTWSVMGLRGTGSQDFVIDDVFVPQSFTCFLGERLWLIVLTGDSYGLAVLAPGKSWW
jgi:alkylation response protein AidB-like acyl-CoA dehydrogenase